MTNIKTHQVSQECEVFDMLNSNDLKKALTTQTRFNSSRNWGNWYDSLIRFERKGLKVIPSSRAVSMTMTE